MSLSIQSVFPVPASPVSSIIARAQVSGKRIIGAEWFVERNGLLSEMALATTLATTFTPLAQHLFFFCPTPIFLVMPMVGGFPRIPQLPIQLVAFIYPYYPPIYTVILIV